MNVIIREAAYHDIGDIHRWIAADRPSAADRVVRRIIGAIELLGQFPRIGHKGRTPGPA